MDAVGRRPGDPAVISVALLAGLAGLWLWSVLNDDDGMFAPVPRVLTRWRWTKKWLRCPWCSGAWFSMTASLIVFHPSVAAAAVTALAAAAVTGLLGSYIQGD